MFRYARNFLLRFNCVFCGQSGCSSRVCDRCMQVFPWNDSYCECCGQPLLSAQVPGVVCVACQRRAPVYCVARAPLRYEFPVNTALKALKFRRQLMYAPAFAVLLLPMLRQYFADVDALVAVPLHRRRQALRGFNQASEICRTLTRHTALPLVTQVVRTRHTPTQSGLSAIARQQNLRKAFALRGHCGDFRCRFPLIVDDVITTGATCEQLASVLLDAGAERVGVLTVARASLRLAV